MEYNSKLPMLPCATSASKGYHPQVILLQPGGLLPMGCTGATACGGRSTGVDPSHGWKCRPSYGRVHVPGRALQGSGPQQEELWDCYCEVGPGRTIGTRYCEGLSQGQKGDSLPQRPAWSARSRTTTYSRSRWGRRSETHKIRVCKLNLLLPGRCPTKFMVKIH
jgi:hypothetical protein